MKYLKKFNESLTDIEYVEILLAEINDYYSMNLSVFEKQDSILIKVEKNKSQDEYVDINLVMDKTIQALSQLSNYEIGTIELYEDGKSYKLSKNNNLSNKKLARVQGFSGSDNLRNLDKYSESDYLMIYIYLVKKEENFITKITKKLFENTSVLLNLTNNVDNELISIIQKLVNPGSKILEISCGNGADAIKLTELGYNVHSTDYDDGYIKHVNSIIGDCIKHNTTNEFPYSDNEFNLVYSRLGLHYFTPEELKDIFDEIHRMTKNYLVFTVKLVNDIPTGKIILTKKSWEDLVVDNFDIISSKEKTGILYDNESRWLEIIAQKK